MTEPVNCPRCHERLEIPPELFGREVRCAACDLAFTVPAPLPTVPRLRVRMPVAEAQRSNRKVWVLLFITAVLCGGLCALCAGFFVWSSNPPFYPADDPEGRFHVEMPGEAMPIRMPGENGTTVKGLEAIRPFNEERYTVKYFDLPAQVDATDPLPILEKAIVQERDASHAGPEVAREFTKHDGYPALDVCHELGPVLLQDVTTIRAVLVGRRVYVLTTKGKNLKPEQWWVRRFFRSFEVAEGPAKAE